MIGVVAIQGDVSEHVAALRRALGERGLDDEIVEVKHSGIIPRCRAVVIPGGESTTLSRLMHREGIAEEIKEAAGRGVPIMGTCAGLILLAKYGDGQVAKTGQRLLGLMDIHVERNAFGRQRDSFEVTLYVKNIGELNAVFIRAPAIVKAGEKVEVLARYGDYIVAAQQDNILGLAFHPELAPDSRAHHYFLDMLQKG